MRWRVVVPLVATIAVTVGALFYVDVHHTTSRLPESSPAAPPSRAPVLASLVAAAAPPRKPAVRAALGQALSSLPTGEEVAGTVVDVMSGTTLWARDARSMVAPASTLKLLTAAAALRRLGPSFRFTTSTRRLGDTVFLVGGGDPTLVRSASPNDTPAGYPKSATLAELAARTAAALPPGHPIRVRADASLWSGPTLAKGWSADYVAEGDVTPPRSLELDGGRLHPDEFDAPRTPDPVGQAAAAFVDLLRNDGVKIRGAVKESAAPKPATALAEVSSPPLAQLVRRMLTNSDNDLAEAVGRALALRDRLPPTFVGAAAAVAAGTTALGVHSAELSLHDTSGLSHDDRVAPDALVTVLRAAATTASLRPIVEGLPVAGFTGTLADRYRGEHNRAGAGVVRAKTGSLTGVNSLAGLVVDGDGRLLAFALLGSGTTDTDAVRARLDQAASALAELT